MPWRDSNSDQDGHIGAVLRIYSPSPIHSGDVLATVTLSTDLTRTEGLEDVPPVLKKEEKPGISHVYHTKPHVVKLFTYLFFCTEPGTGTTQVNLTLVIQSELVIHSGGGDSTANKRYAARGREQSDRER